MGLSLAGNFQITTLYELELLYVSCWLLYLQTIPDPFGQELKSCPKKLRTKVLVLFVFHISPPLLLKFIHHHQRTRKSRLVSKLPTIVFWFISKNIHNCLYSESKLSEHILSQYSVSFIQDTMDTTNTNVYTPHRSILSKMIAKNRFKSNCRLMIVH